MFGISKFWYGIAAALVIFLLYANRPYATALPVTDADLVHLEEDLSRLSTADALLVRAFLERMGGKVDPIGVTNLDRPNNAHTFGEAIEAQKAYEIQQQAEAKRRAIEAEKREAELAPLKAHIQVEWINAEQTKVGDLPVDLGYYSNPDEQVLLLSYRVRNVRGTAIERTQIQTQLYLPTEQYRAELRCELEIGETLRPFTRQEVMCVHRLGSGVSEKLISAATAGESLGFTWQPDYIEFADGRTLKAPSIQSP